MEGDGVRTVATADWRFYIVLIEFLQVNSSNCCATTAEFETVHERDKN